MDEPLNEGPFLTRQGRVWRPLRRHRGRAEVGRWGEWIALRHVLKLGWDVLARNWRMRMGEVDLIARDAGELVFVEVRTRLKPNLEPPEETIDDAKIERIERAAADFLIRHQLGQEPVRLDFIAIETEDLRRYELRHYHL